MARRPRLLTPEERLLWRAAMKTVAPLPGRDLPKEPEPPASAAAGPTGTPPPPPGGAVAGKAATVKPPAEPARPAEPPPLSPGAMAGLDRRTAERIRRGKLPLEGRIDLHGLRQDEAHRVLAGFIDRSHREGKRAVLVITGKGTSRRDSGGGVLKANVPRWLNEPRLRPMVLSFHPARQQHGGDGALYVLLRRRR